MFISSGGGPHVIIKGDKRWEFKPPTKAKLAELLARWRAEDRASLLADIETAGVTGKEKLDMLREFAASDYSWGRGLTESLKIARCLEVLHFTNPGVDVEGLTNDELSAAAADMWGYTWQPDPPESGADNDPRKRP